MLKSSCLNQKALPKTWKDFLVGPRTFSSPILLHYIIPSCMTCVDEEKLLIGNQYLINKHEFYWYKYKVVLESFQTVHAVIILFNGNTYTPSTCWYPFCWVSLPIFNSYAWFVMLHWNGSSNFMMVDKFKQYSNFFFFFHEDQQICEQDPQNALSSSWWTFLRSNLFQIQLSVGLR